MRNSRHDVLYILLCIGIYVVCTGCKADTTVMFCEGVSSEGKGMQCGQVFSSGDVTALIQPKERFETDTLEVKVFEERKNQSDCVETMELSVSPDARSATVNIPLYNEGKFSVRVFGKEKKKVAEGTIEIVDTY